MSIRATGIAYVGYPVSDMDRAKAFYGGVLGLKAGMDACNESMSWVEYEIGEGVLAISNAWPPSPNPGPAVALEVEDFEAAVAHLRQAGVTIKMEPFESPVCHMFIVTDPDGNDVIIHKLKSHSH